MSERPSRQDRLGLAEIRPFDDSLVGAFFHSKTADDRINWQGCVVAEPAPGVYLVELFSWIMGDSTEQRLVRLEEMTTWSFYDTASWMNAAHRDQPPLPADEVGAMNGGDFILGARP